mgnify:CR=1 FL=1
MVGGRNLAAQARGRFGEGEAARWYVQHGYRVLARNWRCELGEIDLVARTFWLPANAKAPVGNVLVLTAGTGDIPVAREALVTARALGANAELIADVGVAGLHRVLSVLPKLAEADAIVVVAGMDGALPSVVGGLVACPVFAVPTSIGYGAAFQGLAALMTMLNACSAGVAVVNIDGGFKGGYLAALVATRRKT